ncbi:DUF2523 domain-containing protein [Massilia sp. CCM 8733]|uniref:DUF2523 domain-containing protein n=1 Tax=Massilia mucilaginosa TaxID=2609282 RepID=A0ABX0P3Q6_9BURK|nr:DUF2523 family protein [Massilia mucilaginosa]NHZ93948.1 DUF2523 domain-containing protein [Massilia mucilaginosa]
MWVLLLAAVNTVVGFVFRSVMVKFVVFFALFFIVTEFLSLLTPLLPDASGLSGSLGGIPSNVWYFLDLFNVTAGIPILLSAYVTRFVIRRIPVIG